MSVVLDDLRAQAKRWESETAESGGLLADHNRAVEAKVAEIADVDVAMGNLQSSGKSSYGPVLAYLRNRKDNLVNELSTMQAQTSQLRAAYDNAMKMRDTFNEATQMLTPAVAPEEVLAAKVAVNRKGK